VALPLNGTGHRAQSTGHKGTGQRELALSEAKGA